MKSIGHIIKKELDKIFKFPRMIFSTLILPGLLIFGIYAFMGQSLSGEVSKANEYQNKIAIVNIPDSFETFLDGYLEKTPKVNLVYSNSVKKIEDLKIDIKEENIDLVISFGENFDYKLENGIKPDISIYFNEHSDVSNSAFDKALTFIEAYKQIKFEEKGWDVNLFNMQIDSKNADESKTAGAILAMLLPMFIVTFIFAGALSIGSDAIAGEKERGTLATLLMAPIRKTDIILSKTISTALISILSAFSSFIGIVASLPLAKDMFPIAGTINYSFYNYLQLILILIIIGILSSSLVLIASTFAKTTKEATSYAMPIYIIAILIATASMFGDIPKEVSMYFIPLYNLTLALKGIFSFELTNIQFLVVILSNIVYLFVINFLLLKMFKSEKVLFNK